MRQLTPDPTLWQRFWRSPWTWLVLALVLAQGAWPWHPGTGPVVTAVVGLWCVVQFFGCADKRWGKP